MVYLKVNKEEFGGLLQTKKNCIDIDLYEDMFYSDCPVCGKEHQLDIEAIKFILEECSKKKCNKFENVHEIKKLSDKIEAQND